MLFSALVGVWCVHRFFSKKREETEKKKKKKKTKGGVDLTVRRKYSAAKLSTFNIFRLLSVWEKLTGKRFSIYLNFLSVF